MNIVLDVRFNSLEEIAVPGNLTTNEEITNYILDLRFKDISKLKEASELVGYTILNAETDEEIADH